MRPTLALTALFLLAGCDAFSGSTPEVRRVLGSLSVDASVQTITVPETIRAGERALITVLTDGSSCETESDTEVAFVDGAVEIRPYDLTKVLRGNEACGYLLKRIPHTAEVTFPTAGPILIRAVGEQTDGTPQTRELTVVVL